MAFSLIAHAVAASTNASTVTTASINSTGANLLIAWTAESAEIAAGVITDSKGNTWVSVVSEPTTTGGFGSRVRCWACLSPTVGTGHTATCTTSGGKPSLSFEAFATGSTAASVDVTVGTSTTTSVTTLATGTLTPTGNNELLLSAVAFASNSTASANASYTALDTAGYTLNARGLATAYQIQTTGTARNVTWTVATPSALSVAQAAFLVLSGGTGTLTVTKATSPVGSPQTFTFDAFATSSATLYTASGAVTTVSSPRWSPDGTLVTFAAAGSNPGIYSIHSDGTTLTRLTTTAGDDYPCFNPAGDRIVYQSLVTGVYQVFIMHIDGTVQTQLTAVAGSSGTRPTYNSAGTLILYVKTVTATGVGELWTMAADGTSKTLKLNMTPNNVTEGVFSASDTYLLVNATGIGAGVYRMNGDTTSQMLLPLTGTVSDVHWAPDTSGFTFTAGATALGWANASGLGQTTVFNTVTSTYPSYTASGKILVFAGSSGTTLLTLTSLIAPALFTLTDATSRSFTGLTAGSSYRLAEAAVSGWTTVYTVSNGSITAITIAANATTTVRAANTQSAISVTTRNIRRLRQGPHMSSEQQWIFHQRFQLDCTVGVGNSDAADPQVTLYWSDDGGYTYSSGLARSLGVAAAYLTRVLWNRLGRSRDRVYRIVIDDPVDVALFDGYAMAEGGTPNA